MTNSFWKTKAPTDSPSIGWPNPKQIAKQGGLLLVAIAYLGQCLFCLFTNYRRFSPNSGLI